jgi:hypothetical protein
MRYDDPANEQILAELNAGYVRVDTFMFSSVHFPLYLIGTSQACTTSYPKRSTRAAG